MPHYPERPSLILHEDDETPRRPFPARLVIGIIAFLFFLFVLIHNGAPLYTDWLWFNEMGRTSVFTGVIRAKSTLFFGYGALFFLIWHLPFRNALRLLLSSNRSILEDRFTSEVARKIRSGLGKFSIFISLFLSLWAGRIASAEWANLLEFRNAVSFGAVDPIFGKDYSFYLFKLPFIEFTLNFISIAIVIAGIGVGVVHVLKRSAATLAGMMEPDSNLRGQLFAILGAFAVVRGIAACFSPYELLNRENGVFSGPSYVDLRLRVPVTYIEAGLLFAAGILLWISLKSKKAERYAIGCAAVYVGVTLLLGTAAPAGLQKLVVEPNQFTLEAPYIRNNIAGTRKGFGLETVRRVDNFPADESLTVSALKADSATLDNVRLWDYGFLAQIFAQVQTVKTYYKFERDSLDGTPTQNLDVDRYQIDGAQRQVILAGREINSSSLPPASQTWQNLKLGYTHGYGVVASPVNKSVGGQPEYLVDGFPPKSKSPALKVDRPEIYFGQLTREHVYVDSGTEEFDYPSSGDSSGQDHYSKYAGSGGIPVGDSALKRIAFAFGLNDWNAVWTKDFTPQTRILLRRDIRDRVMTLAPFLQLDTDPYLVISNGRLIWMLDAYTLSDRFPCSSPQRVAVGPASFIAPNYIRNSVKATVDAYDGTTHLYLADAKDPIAQTYSRAFPGLLESLDQMPVDLKSHLRYPEDLFRLQRAVYAAYHVDDPRVFYANEDQWAAPYEPNHEGDAKPLPMEPYYVTLRLPGETKAEYLLMSPLAPFNKEDQNILGWMCARCDPERYGELELYRFPQQAAIPGPTQIIARINGDPVISPQLSLLRQGGSSAVFGNMLVLPIDKSLLTIAPLYIASTNSTKLPQLQKVVVSYGTKVVMENTLNAALDRLFPGYAEGSSPQSTTNQGSPPTTPPAGNEPKQTVKSLATQASQEYDSAKAALKSGDFAEYGARIKKLEATLDALKRLTK